ncbi:restriction endonuclease subunit S [Polaribacter litorisediminis]|nr:restriction endonuclease subunit S [Polaribacter litorisediminis]
MLFEIEKKKAPGGIIKTITKEVLSSFNVMIPILDEQTKIADFLSNIDLKIDALNTKMEHSKTFKKGLLQKMFV